MSAEKERKMAKVSKKESKVVTIQPIKMEQVTTYLVGKRPLLVNRYLQKAWHELLLPSRKMNRSERDSSLKHDPLAEFRGSCYRNRDPRTPTLFHIPEGMIHQSMAHAALDIPGATKAEIGRLTSITSTQINLYGIPQLFMAMVRNSDINHTPDVRTRAAFPEWACTVTIEYKVNPLTDSQILNLLAAAGMIVGIGDWRPEKKGGPFGKFRIANANDKEFKAIVAKQGRAPQQKAFDNPTEYDEDSAELMAWFNAEIARREKELPSQRMDMSESIQ